MKGKTGTSLRFQGMRVLIGNDTSYGKKKREENKCYSCGLRLNLMFRKLYEDNFYCDSCYLQVSHGVKLPKFKK